MSNIIYHNGIQCYSIDGKKYPRVTTVLDIFYRKMYGQPSQQMKNYMAARAKIGTAVHTLIERSIHGLEILQEHKEYMEGEPYRFFMQALPTVKSWIETEVITHSEVRVKSEKYRVAGTADLIIKDTAKPGHYRIVDFKTAKKSKTERELTGYFLQMACYAMAARETLGLNISGGDILFLLENKSKLISIESDELLNHAKHFVRLRNEFYRQHGI